MKKKSQIKIAYGSGPLWLRRALEHSHPRLESQVIRSSSASHSSLLLTYNVGGTE